MQNIINRLNIYDTFGYILVGLFQIISVWVLIATVTIINLPIPNLFSFESSVLIIIISYFLGHIVQALSNIIDLLLEKLPHFSIEKMKKENVNPELEYIYKRIIKYFDLSKKLNKKYIYQYGYLYALSNDISGHVSLFNSLYSMYRGFYTTSVITVIAFIFFYFFIQITKTYSFGIEALLSCIAYVIIALLFNGRKDRFFNYCSEKTLITFDIFSKKEK